MPDFRAAVTDLPAGERDVVSLMCRGLTYRQVAEQLGVAEGVVRASVRRALTRLAHSTRSDVTTSG